MAKTHGETANAESASTHYTLDEVHQAQNKVEEDRTSLQTLQESLDNSLNSDDAPFLLADYSPSELDDIKAAVQQASRAAAQATSELSAEIDQLTPEPVVPVEAAPDPSQPDTSQPNVDLPAAPVSPVIPEAPEPAPAPEPPRETGSDNGAANNAPPGYHGPRCYAPGGKTWTRCPKK